MIEARGRPVPNGSGKTLRLGPILVWLATCCVIVVIGVGEAANSQLRSMLFVCFAGGLALAVPAGVWVTFATAAAITLTFGYAPSIATPLAWGALLAAILHCRQFPSRTAAVVFRWLGLLVFAVGLSWAFNPSEVARPLVYLALLGQPFAIVLALLLDPPSPRLRRALVQTLVLLVAIQIPLAAWQVHRYGLADPDRVQGTMAFARAHGAHLIAGVLLVACVWLIASRRRRITWWVAVTVVVLLAEPVVADAKQVLFVLPVGVLIAAWRSGRLSVFVNGALVMTTLAALIVVGPYSHTQELVYRLQQLRTGHNGKVEVAKIVWGHLESNPASVFFGKGPAETVSRTAFLTTNQDGHSLLGAVRLQPAKIAEDAQAGAQEVSGGGTSLNSGVSSMLGVFGDLGVFGAVAYAGLFFSVLLAVSRKQVPEAVAAMAGWVMLLILGFVFDWWEQPPFTLFLAVLTGLALTAAPPARPAFRVSS